MEFISSDTNIWIDFYTISKLHLPFLLPYTYLMYYESAETELCTEGLREDLHRMGLMSVDITLEEFQFADELGTTHSKLSIADRIALAIAKKRGIPLLTGDGRLRAAADRFDVPVFGTIWILDKLFTEEHISEQEYRYCLQELKKVNGGVVRLPAKAIQMRLDGLSPL